MCMITMVCVSVFSTGVVMHLGDIKRPMPRWVKCVFLVTIPRFLFLSVQSHDIVHVELNKSSNQRNRENSVQSGEENATGNNTCSDLVELREAIALLRYIKADMDTKNQEAEDHMQWKRLSRVVDRILLYLFTLFTVLCTLILSIQIIRGSEMDHEEILRELEEY